RDRARRRHGGRCLRRTSRASSWSHPLRLCTIDERSVILGFSATQWYAFRVYTRWPNVFPGPDAMTEIETFLELVRASFPTEPVPRTFFWTNGEPILEPDPEQLQSRMQHRRWTE